MPERPGTSPAVFLWLTARSRSATGYRDIPWSFSILIWQPRIFTWVRQPQPAPRS